MIDYVCTCGFEAADSGSLAEHLDFCEPLDFDDDFNDEDEDEEE